MRAQHGGHSYPVILAESMVPAVLQALQAWPKVQRVAIVCDRQVGGLFARQLLGPLRRAGLWASLHAFAPGEDHKTLGTAAALYATLSDAGISRTDVVLGLGGGLSTDLAGYVAATHLRGIPFIAVATTTMGAIDAAVGGKTGVNTPAGKNQVGVIRAPGAVVVALDALAQQDGRGRRAGLIEALKMAALYDPALVPRVVAAAHPRADLRCVIGYALAHKIAVCAADPNDASARAALNYGHTVGHAIEVGSNFALLHGEAVGLGMMAEAAFAERMGLAEGVVAQLSQALMAMNMPQAWRRATVDYPSFYRDKKGDGGTITLPVVAQMGTMRLHEVALADLAAFLRTP